MESRDIDARALPAVLLTPERVAAELGLPVRSILRGRLRRLLPWLKIGRRLRMHPDSLQECIRGDLLAANRTGVTSTWHEHALELKGPTSGGTA